MVKNKDKNNVSIGNYDFGDLADDIGGSLLDKTDSVKCWIDTGNLALNYLCSGKFVGGGIPSNKIIEIFGPSSSCKTLFATNVLKGCQKCGGFALFLDAENTLDKDFAQKVSHLETSKVIVLKADSLQRAFAKMVIAIRKIREKFGQEKPIVIVYDSIAASPSDREYNETEMSSEEKMIQAKDMPGERAKTISKEMRKLTPLVEQNNCTVLFINQVRQKVGMMFGDPTTTTGGLALPFYTSLRLKTKTEKKFEDKLGNVIGMGVTVKNVKNKCFKPFVEARNMQLFYDKGINPFSGLLELLVQTERIVAISPGSFKVSEPYAMGQEVKFKSAIERNDVPIEVLLKCPGIVDAQNPEQVQEYVDTFGKALDAMNNDVAKEEEVSDDEE